MSFNVKFNQSIKIVEVEKIHSTHFIIRFEWGYYIKVYLSPEKDCCEIFGINVFYRNKPVSIETLHLQGEYLNGIRLINIKKELYSEKNERHIIIYTSIGLVNLIVYNEHNGYYPHDFELDIYTSQIANHLKEKL